MLSQERTICELVTQLDVLFRVDDNLLDAIHVDDLRVAVRVTRMVDQTATGWVRQL